jgi:hypothetical protein
MENLDFAVGNIIKAQTQLCTNCLVCGEPVLLSQWEEIKLCHGGYIQGKICDKCKAAILYMREKMS